MIKVKICGLSRLEDIEAANLYQPDYIGFVFAPSRRRVTEEQAASLKKLLSPAILAVGVFADQTPETIARLCREEVIDIIQLHGAEDACYIERLRSLVSSPIIKALKAPTPEDIRAAKNLDCDYLLFDGAQAGSGQAFDWSVLPTGGKPYFLAGGLHLGNIDAAMAAGRPFALDISSGAEEDGRKSPGKIKELVEMIRSVS